MYKYLDNVLQVRYKFPTSVSIKSDNGKTLLHRFGIRNGTYLQSLA